MGYDSPIHLKNEDLLDRWPFAQQVARITTEAPPEWSVRVGVYGGWGQGKTSSLYFVKGLVEEQGNLVVTFNPWGASSSAELWTGFLVSLIACLENPAESVFSTKEIDEFRRIAGKLRSNETLQKLTSAIGALADVHSVSKAGAAVGLPFLKSYLDANRKNLADVTSALGDRRVVVLVDDLDRTSPQLLPQLLYSLRELLNLSGFSFVLAIDPIRVGEVLASVNQGWEDGAEYLKKIVDFALFLPPMTRGQVHRLVINDIQKFCPFVPQDAIKGVLDHLPPNPRFIRQFVRQTWVIEPQIDRHDVEELDWHSILLSQLLRQRWVRLWDKLFGDDESSLRMIEELWQQHEYNSLSRDESTRSLTLVDDLVKDPRFVATTDKDEARNLLNDLTNPGRYQLPKNILYNARLVCRAPGVTWREYDEIQEQWKNGGFAPVVVIEWIKSQSEKVFLPEQTVYLELVEAARERHVNANRRAIDAPTEAGIRTMMAGAGESVRFLQAILVDVGAHFFPEHNAPAKLLIDCLKAFELFFHFDEPEYYSSVRRSEACASIRMALRGPFDTIAALEALEPWGYRPLDSDAEKNYWPILETLIKLLERRVAYSILDDLLSGKDPILDGTERNAAREYVFLLKEGPLWSGRFRCGFQSAIRGLSGSEGSAVVAAGLLRFIASRASGRDQQVVGADAASALVQENEETMRDLWASATTYRINRRWIGSMNNETLPVIESILSTKLPRPEWWPDDESVES